LVVSVNRAPWARDLILSQNVNLAKLPLNLFHPLGSEGGPGGPAGSLWPSTFGDTMQGKLIKKAYSVATADVDGNFNDDTLTALGAFQDNNALILVDGPSTAKVA
jgi:hypothetical protein